MESIKASTYRRVIPGRCKTFRRERRATHLIQGVLGELNRVSVLTLSSNPTRLALIGEFIATFGNKTFVEVLTNSQHANPYKHFKKTWRECGKYSTEDRFLQGLKNSNNDGLETSRNHTCGEYTVRVSRDMWTRIESLSQQIKQSEQLDNEFLYGSERKGFKDGIAE